MKLVRNKFLWSDSMDEQLKGYLHDLIILLHEKYNDTLEDIENEKDDDKVYRTGKNFAYYDALDLIESQLNTFGYDVKQIGKIAPNLGNKASLK